MARVERGWSSHATQRTWRNPPRVDRQDLLRLLFRLTSGLDGSSESIVALIRVPLQTAFNGERRRKTDDNGGAESVLCSN